jgi:hypothetical protein
MKPAGIGDDEHVRFRVLPFVLKTVDELVRFTADEVDRNAGLLLEIIVEMLLSSPSSTPRVHAESVNTASVARINALAFRTETTLLLYNNYMLTCVSIAQSKDGRKGDGYFSN